MAHDPRERWRVVFTHLLRLYPHAFRTRFARPIRDAFLDAYDARAATGRPLAPLLLHTGADLAFGIVRERATDGLARLRRTPLTYAAIGVAHATPLVMLNAVVSARMEPFYSFIRPTAHTALDDVAVLAIVLLLLPIGAVVSTWPLLRPVGPHRQRTGRRAVLALNALGGLLLVTVFTALAVALGTEVYHCDVLMVPNCD